jgi:DNA-binding transcriptional regulator YdaS (Cro superfamily)
MQAKRVTSVEAIMGELGKQAAIARQLGVTPQAVSQWKKKNRIPSLHFLTMQRMLSAKGVDAPVTLWGFEQEAAE